MLWLLNLLFHNDNFTEILCIQSIKDIHQTLNILKHNNDQTMKFFCRCLSNIMFYMGNKRIVSFINFIYGVWISNISSISLSISNEASSRIVEKIIALLHWTLDIPIRMETVHGSRWLLKFVGCVPTDQRSNGKERKYEENWIKWRKIKLWRKVEWSYGLWSTIIIINCKRIDC